MKIYFSPYELTAEVGSRQGALLKVIDNEGDVGYADCHPWPELGDLPLQAQLQQLLQQEMTPLTAQSLAFAKIDTAFRKQNKNAFETLNLPKSHYLVMRLTKKVFVEVHEAVKQGFDLFKIKLGKALSQEIPLLLELLEMIPKVRLDFNGTCTRQQFCDFLALIKPFLEKIDFIEDPFLFEASSWAQIQENYGVTLACDRHAEQACGVSSAAKVLVHKPAVEKLFKSVSQKIVVTSYLDHPLGQACAAFIAAKHCPDLICGLNSHRVYRPNPYSAQLEWNLPEFKIPSGIGFGFDDLLENERWQSLV